jgi:hypothetical protein
MYHDPLRVAAERVAGRIRRGAVVGADHVVAVVLQPFGAVGAALAAIDDAADADQIVRLEVPRLADCQRTARVDSGRHETDARVFPLKARRSASM